MDWEDVYSFLERIPLAKVCTYADIATPFGSGGRAVGQCLNKIRDKYRHGEVNEDRTHRVVIDNGSLPDRGGGLNTQRLLLENEGVTFVNDRVDLTKYRAKL